MVRKVPIPLAIVIILGIAAMVSIKTYYVRDKDADAHLLSHADEAYVFIGINRFGWSGSYLWSLRESIKEYFGAISPPESKRSSIVVLRLAPDGVQRYVADGFEPGSYTPFEKNIYTYDRGVLWKWSGSHFESATAEERKRFDSATSSDTSRWSETTNVLSRADDETKFSIELEGKPLVLVVRRNKGMKSIELQGPNQQPHIIWSLDENPRRITKTEYEQEFRSSR